MDCDMAVGETMVTGVGVEPAVRESGDYYDYNV
jgi:hypothetical protein